MPDNLTAEQRRYCMSRIKSKDTGPEVRVRSALHRRGLRFRKHVSELPGKPDVVFPRARVAVFVDGGFWHVSEFWKNKIDATIARDQMDRARLTEMGWTVVRLWQHELKNDFEGCVDGVVCAIRDGPRVSPSERNPG